MAPLTLTLSTKGRGESKGTEATVSPGEKLNVNGTLPKRLADARVRLTLERTVDSVPNDLEPIPSTTSTTRDRVILSNHEQANRFVVAASDATVRDGRFQGTLDVPKKLPWPRLIVRVYAANEHEEAMAVQTLQRSAANRNGGP
jgi:hypothetical protein